MYHSTSFRFLLCLSYVLVYAGRNILGDETQKLHIHDQRQNVAVLTPTVHASLLESPTYTNPHAATFNFLDDIGKRISGLFGHSSHNSSTSKGEDTKTVDDGEKDEHGKSDIKDVKPSNEAVNRFLKSEQISPTPNAQGTPRKNEKRKAKKNEEEGTQFNKNMRLTPTKDDIVTARMRLTSFIEGVSASLEDMHKTLVHFPWVSRKTKGYEIVSRNESMLIVHVPGKRFFSTSSKHRVKPVRAVFHKHKLTVEVEESSFIENRDNSSKISEETFGIGTEYHFSVKKARVDVDGIFLKATQDGVPGYHIFIPLLPKSADDNMESVTRTVTEATGRPATHWGTNREEDEYDYLQSQAACQKKFGTSGIKKLLCTCEKIHARNLKRKLLCVTRIADRVVRVAKLQSEPGVASRVYHGSVRCRNPKLGIGRSYTCLTALLRRHAGEKSRFHAKHGRNILESEAEAATEAKIDELVGKQAVKPEELLQFEDDETTEDIEQTGLSVLHMLTMLVYLAGLAFLAFCLFDVWVQYRKHSRGSRTDGRLSRLPAQAQALYERLVARNE